MIPIYPGSRVGHVVNDVGCWIWTGAVSWNGYGRVGVPRTKKTAQAHRVYYERVYGRVPRTTDLDHLCRNRRCVNPAHLEPVRRHINAWRGAKPKITPDNVHAIRKLYAAGGTTTRRLGERYGISHTTICNILSGKRWSKVA